MKKTILKTALYLATFSTFFVLATVCFSTTASAYIDPSAMTYIIQIGVGIIIAGGAAFGYYFKKIKRKMNKKEEPSTDYKLVEEEKFENDDEFDVSQIKENERN